MADNPGLLAVFAYIDDLEDAIGTMKKRNIPIDTVYSPSRNDELLNETLGKKPSPVRYFTLLGGILGILTGYGLSVYTAMQWKLVVSGKPIVPIVPYVIESCEFCILLGIIFNLIGVLVLTRLPKLGLPDHYDPRFSVDRFGLLVRCSTEEQEQVAKLLSDSGAEDVNTVGA